MEFQPVLISTPPSFFFTLAKDNSASRDVLEMLQQCDRGIRCVEFTDTSGMFSRLAGLRVPPEGRVVVFDAVECGMLKYLTPYVRYSARPGNFPVWSEPFAPLWGLKINPILRTQAYAMDVLVREIHLNLRKNFQSQLEKGYLPFDLRDRKPQCEKRIRPTRRIQLGSSQSGMPPSA